MDEKKEISTEVVPQQLDYQKILRERDSFDSVVEALVQPENEAATKHRISSRENKIQGWFGKQEDLPAEKVRDLRVRMMNFVDEFFAKVHVDEARELTPAEAESLMAEFLNATEFGIAFEARRRATKEMVFNSLTAKNIKDGIPEPDNHNGWLEVPELGKKFCREGTGHKEPTLDEEQLHKLLGDANWAKVTDEEFVPSEVRVTLNQDRFMNLARKNPEMLEYLRQCLTPGPIKSPRFQIRDIENP